MKKSELTATISDKNKQAEFEGCYSFLLSKLGQDAVNGLVTGAGDNAVEFVINTAISLKGQFDELTICNQRDKFKAIENDLAGYFKELLTVYANDFEPFAQTILDDGSATWSKTASIELANGDSITITCKAINPDYDKPDMTEKRNLSRQIQGRLEKDATNRWEQVSGLVTFKRNTKKNASFSMLKKPIESGGLKWNVSLGYVEKDAE